MKKIAFHDRCGLTYAVRTGEKTMVRKIVSERIIEAGFEDYYVVPTDSWYGRETPDGAMILASKESYERWKRDNTQHVDGAIVKPTYKKGEIVGVAQAYKIIHMDMLGDITNPMYRAYMNATDEEQTYGWDNRSRVKAELMPIRIRIDDVRLERLHNISDNDCIREGVRYLELSSGEYRYDFPSSDCTYDTPLEAFIDMWETLHGRDAWEKNPWVVVYKFTRVR